MYVGNDPTLQLGLVLVQCGATFGVFSSLGQFFYVMFPNFTVHRTESFVHFYFLCTKVESFEYTVLCGSNHYNRKIRSSYGGILTLTSENVENLSPATSKMSSPCKVNTTIDVVLSVKVIANKYSMGTLLVLPVSSWGRKYIVMTAKPNPTIHIMTNEGQVVWILFKCSLSCKQFLSQKSAAFVNGSNFIDSEKALTISFCYIKYAGDLTGTRIHADKPLGVIAGNCLAYTSVENCSQPSTSLSSTTDGDLAVETVLPVHSYGTHFISFTTTKDGSRRTKSENYVYALQPNTSIAIHFLSKTQTVFIQKAGGVYNYYLLKNEGSHRIISKKPIQVMYLMRSSCKEEMFFDTDIGDVAFCYLVPNSLFYNSYAWIGSEDINIHIVIIKLTATLIFFNNEDIMNFYIPDLKSVGDNYEVFEIVYNEDFILRSTNKDKFGCYVYAIDLNVAFLNVVGFHMNYSCVKTKPVGDDKIDNDCDGEIDEEIEDILDDDLDKMVDEDVKKKINGNWSAWQEWQCTNTSHHFRTRECNSPKPFLGGKDCVGDKNEIRLSADCETSPAYAPNFGYWIEWSPWDCSLPCTGIETITRRRECRKDAKAYGEHCVGFNNDTRMCTNCSIEYQPCSSFRWGKRCENDCYNCRDNCSRMEGKCSKCNAGFKNPRKACQEVCDFNEYGENCEFSCIEKCGSDCGERVFGTCLVSNRVYYMFLLLLILPIFALLYFLRKENVEEILVQSSTTSPATSLMTSTMTTGTLATTIMTRVTSSNIETTTANTTES